MTHNRITDLMDSLIILLHKSATMTLTQTYLLLFVSLFV